MQPYDDEWEDAYLDDKYAHYPDLPHEVLEARMEAHERAMQRFNVW